MTLEKKIDKNMLQILDTSLKCKHLIFEIYLFIINYIYK